MTSTGEQTVRAATEGHADRVSVIIPAKDEAKCLETLIPLIKESLSGYDSEIIVVDDGSKDETREVAQRASVTVISHERNYGKGAAMKTGVRSATGDIVVFLDADCAHKPRDIPTLIAPLLRGKADIVIGSRSAPGSRVSGGPLRRRLTNCLASLVISLTVSILIPIATLFRRPIRYVRITDCTSGFRAMRRETWHSLNLTSQRFEIEAEMIYEAVKNRLIIVDVPISCDWNSHISHLSIFRDGWGTSRLLARKLVRDVTISLRRGE